MFKIFLRKRFVCGYRVKLDSIDFFDVKFHLPLPDGVICEYKDKWIVSYEKIEEVRLFLKYENCLRILYDRKTKVTIEGLEDITNYLKEIEH